MPLTNVAATPSTLDPEEQRALVVRATAGDAASYGRLYRVYLDRVHHYVRFRVGEPAAAEDITQDVFLSAYQHLGQLRDPNQFRAWLWRIAHNRVLNHWRARAQQPFTVSLPDEAIEDDGIGLDGRVPALQARTDPSLVTLHEPLERLETQFQWSIVQVAMGRLTQLQQQVLALRFIADLSVAETAEVMERTPNAIHNLQHHALAALRHQLLPVTQGQHAHRGEP